MRWYSKCRANSQFKLLCTSRIISNCSRSLISLSCSLGRTAVYAGFSMGNLLKPAVIEGRTSRGPFKTWEEMTPINYAIETRDLSVLRYLVDAFSRVGPGGKEFLARLVFKKITRTHARKHRKTKTTNALSARSLLCII